MTLARKRLDELFNAGKEYDIAPAGQEPFPVFVRKLGPTQQTTAAREANSARMLFTLKANDPESGYYRTLAAEVAEIPLEDKIRQLAMTEIAEDREKLEQEISGRKEWAEEGRLQTLVNLWEGGLMAEYMMAETDEERDPEAVRVWNEMKEFTDEVDDKLEKRLGRETRALEALPPEDVDKKMMEAQIEFDASAEWIRTFRMYQIMYGVRDLETNEPIFTSLREVEDTPAELFAKLAAAVMDLNIPITQVKS